MVSLRLAQSAQRFCVTLVALVLIGKSVFISGQQTPGATTPLEIVTTALPRAYLRQPYEARLEARGGIAPLKWTLTEGSLPAGVTLQPDGVLSGIPTETGEFKFTVTVSDSGKPAYQKSQSLVLKVVAPLLAQWGRYPKINGHRVEGSRLWFPIRRRMISTLR